MKTQTKVFPLKHLIVMTADGKLDLLASKTALKSLVAAPGFEASYEVLLDLRDINCSMSVTDIYELAAHMAYPDAALPTRRKIAVLIDSHSPHHLAFDHAKFLEIAAGNRGFQIRAFDDYDRADEWLNADLPADPKEPA